MKLCIELKITVYLDGVIILHRNSLIVGCLRETESIIESRYP